MSEAGANMLKAPRPSLNAFNALHYTARTDRLELNAEISSPCLWQ
jgi:hypothetical protein